MVACRTRQCTILTLAADPPDATQITCLWDDLAVIEISLCSHCQLACSSWCGMPTSNDVDPNSSTTQPSRLPYYVYLTEDAAQIYDKSTRAGNYALSPDELWWSARESCLSTAGYTLRQRYRANWRPSWLGTRLNPLFCEDSIMSEVRPKPSSH